MKSKLNLSRVTFVDSPSTSCKRPKNIEQIKTARCYLHFVKLRPKPPRHPINRYEASASNETDVAER